MRRNGTVAAMNPSRGMVAIGTEDDGYTRSEIYKNVTKGTREEVYVQNHGVSKANLRQQLLF